MSLKNTSRKVKFGELVANTATNARFSSSAPVAGVTVDTYNIDAMEMLLWESRGQLHEPMKVERRADGKYDLLQGFRRYFGLQRFAQNDKLPADIGDNLNKIPVVVYDDLTPQERLTIIHDHGGRQDLYKSEIVASIWALSYNGFSPKEVIMRKYYDIARMTGNDELLRNVPQDEKLRETFVTGKLYPTVNGFYISVYKAGDYWQNQLMLTLLEKDGLLRDGEVKDGIAIGRDPRPQFKITHQRWNALQAAWKADKEKGNYEPGNTIPLCGPIAKGVIEGFIAKDAGKSVDTPKMLTAKAVKERRDVSKSNLERLVLDHVATGQPVNGLAEAAANVARLEGLDTVAVKSIDRVAANATVNLREFLRHVAHSSPVEFETAVARYCPTPAATESVSEQPTPVAETVNAN